VAHQGDFSMTCGMTQLRGLQALVINTQPAFPVAAHPLGIAFTSYHSAMLARAAAAALMRPVIALNCRNECDDRVLVTSLVPAWGKAVMFPAIRQDAG
jgi:hypothetical protein